MQRRGGGGRLGRPRQFDEILEPGEVDLRARDAERVADAAFRELRTQVMKFDPVADIQSIIDNLAKTVDRVLKKLNLEDLLAEPLQLYDQILAAFSSLRPAELLQPALDQLDRIAGEVDAGLTETVTSFRALQDALPDHVGSTSLAVSASAG